MRARIQENQLKGILLIILFAILAFQSFIAQAQLQRKDNAYRGFIVSFGTRSAVISSDIAKIDQTNPMAVGGQLGLVYGNSVFRVKAGLLGYYSSTGTTAGTTDLYESNIAVNFYPLSLIANREWLIEPYLTGGASYDRIKFFGYYINGEPGVTNYSQGEAPFLGKVTLVNTTAGVGFEVKLKDRFDFIHLFSELNYAHNVSSKTGYEAFARTSLMNQMRLVVGVSFGAHR